jgi:tetratricopeptide (TPR) repeat protein
MNASALARAEALLEADAPRRGEVAAAMDTAPWRALAWALKDDCLAAWTADPPATARCAAALARMNEAQPDPEVAALALWAEGIAALAAGRLDDARALLERTHDALVAAGHPRAAGETLVPKVMTLAMLGLHAQALECGQQARSLFLAAGDGPAAGRVELNLGTLLFRLDRHAEAAGMYRSAAVHFARARDAARSILADIGLAHALTWQFDFDEALRINERALRRAEQRELRVPQAQARLAIGRIELLRGRYRRALNQLAQAQALMEAAGAAPQQRLEAAGALADAYLAVNLLPEAHNLYDRVIDVAISLGTPTEEARARVERARVRGRLGQRASALEDLSRALVLFGQAGNAVAAADVELAAGQLRLEAADARAAAAHAVTAWNVLRDSGVSSWQLDAQNLGAAAALQLGDLAAAGDGFAAALEHARTLGLVPQQVAARVGQGELALRTQRPDDACLVLGHALELVETARSELADDEFRSAVAALGARAHRLLVRATAARMALGEVKAAALFEAVERGRARAFTQGLAEASLHDAEGADRGDRAAAPDDARGQFMRQRWREIVATGHEGQPERHAAELRRLEAEWLELARQQRLRQAEKTLPGARARAGWASATRVLQALADDQALVAFHLDGEELTACVLRQGAVHCRAWGAPGVAEAVEALRFQIETPRQPGALLGAHAALLLRRVRVRAQSLHDLVWAPLTPLLEGVRRLVVVPHQALHYVPWCALHDGRGWLVQRHEVVVAASASAWLASAGAGAGAGRPVERVLVLGADDQLPQVRQEVQAIGRIFGARATLCLGEAARADALVTHAHGHAPGQGGAERGLGAADVVHLACHAQFRADNPEFSSLSLAGGPLTLHDLRSLSQAAPAGGAPLFRAALVVLSACETGLSRVAAGDELIGLVRGFALAGARAVLATQWVVSDASMAERMAEWYRHVFAGVAPAAALQRVQRAAAERGLHPFQWAALTLYGQG